MEIDLFEVLEDIETYVYTCTIIQNSAPLNHAKASEIRSKIEDHTLRSGYSLRSNKSGRPPSHPIPEILYNLENKPSPLSELLNSYPSSSLNLDLWGLLHSGVTPYSGVLKSLRMLKVLRYKLNVISNSSKRLGETRKHLTSLGFDINLFENIITSGEVTFQYLLTLQPKKFFILGSGASDDLTFVTDSGHTVVYDIKTCDCILARGTFKIYTNPVQTKTTTLEYESIVKDLLNEAIGKEMLICNPDVYRPDPEIVKQSELDIMPGMIERWYESILTSNGLYSEDLIYSIGKPHPLVFEEINKKDDSEYKLMFGDSLQTDVLGSNRMTGWKSVWVTDNGIHRGATNFDSEIEKEDIKPDYIIQTFSI